MLNGESSCLGGAEYVWHRGVKSLQAKLRPPKVDPYFKRWEVKYLKQCSSKWASNNFDLRAKSSQEDVPNVYKKSSQEGFALRWKLWPANSLLHHPIFDGNSRSTGISQLRSGKTRSKNALSHFSSGWRPNRWHQIKKLGFNSSNLLWGRSVASELKPRQVHRLFFRVT